MTTDATEQPGTASTPDDRLARLEAQVAQLTASLDQILRPRLLPQLIVDWDAFDEALKALTVLITLLRVGLEGLDDLEEQLATLQTWKAEQIDRATKQAIADATGEDENDEHESDPPPEPA